MITEDQQIWLDHLSDTETVSVIPFDPSCEAKFLKVKVLIQDAIGASQEVVHRGASSLRISGQDEIDIYVPVAKDEFDAVVTKVSLLFGQPRSLYPLKRARFVTFIDKKHVDVFVINQDDASWIDSERFYEYLMENPKTLDEYRTLKEMATGKSVREYYRFKIEFINDILNNM